MGAVHIQQTLAHMPQSISQFKVVFEEREVTKRDIQFYLGREWGYGNSEVTCF